MTQFGSSFIPVHFVGALFEGLVPAGHLNLNYNVGIGNGRGQIISRAGDAGDINNNRAWLTNIYIKPDALYGLQYVQPLWIAAIHVALGEKEQALDRLQSSFDDRSPGLVFLKVDPVFDAVRPDPRFTALMHRTGL